MSSGSIHIDLDSGKKVYFASDFHLGSPDRESSLAREKKIVSWLESISNDAAHIFILGDVFDFWFEYRHTVPKGHIRLLGKLMELRDRRIPISFFTGNHDMWMFGYFENEFDIPVFRKPQVLYMNQVKCLIGHGDGLGPGDRTYKVIKKVFENRFAQSLFRWMPTHLAYGLAHYWSGHSRNQNSEKDLEFLGEKEWLVRYCREIETREHHDYYIFGHRHLPVVYPLKDNSQYINTGDWIETCSYAVFDGHDMKLTSYEF